MKEPAAPLAEPCNIWRCGRHVYDLSRRPLVMGILNVTPDSFSDGNSYASVAAAVAAAEKMVAAGADIIDVGGESTRPGAKPVSVDEELARVIPVIEGLVTSVSVPVSIDTWKAKVASAALTAGAEIVNDISAMTFDPLMVDTVAATNAGVVLMHTRGRPQEMQIDTVYSDIVAEIAAFLKEAVERAESRGISAQRVLVDPGIGFGKSVNGNLELIRRLDEFLSLGRPLLIGPSRKSFIGKILGRETDERLFGTAAVVSIAMQKGARIFRVHDVNAMRDVVDMTAAILQL
jgi:dihydropteroate synthase